METERPGVILWFKIYAGLCALMYLICAAAGVFLIVMADDPSLGMRSGEALVQGIIFVAVAVPLMILNAVALFLAPRPGAWIYDLVLICIGMTGCCLPASVPLLIFWIKPETKAYFGRE